MTEQLQTISPFSVEIDDNRIAIVRINVADQTSNWLPENFVSDLRDVIGTIIYQQV